MAYEEVLAERVRKIFGKRDGVFEKKMFGGLTFMVNGKMCVGILKDDLMVRIDPGEYEAALRRKDCREMNFTGKPMKGFVFVGPEGTNSKEELEYWINLALNFNKSAKVTKREKEV